MKINPAINQIAVTDMDKFSGKVSKKLFLQGHAAVLKCYTNPLL